MREIKKEEMTLVEGGADPVLITSIVSAIIIFLVGALHGYSNPKSCNN